MSIVVTGAGGFVGRLLVKRLIDAGKHVVAMDNVATGIPAGARAVAGDIGSPEVRAEAFRDGCSALIHLATVPGGAAEADPAASRRVNIDAMYDLLEDAKAAGDRPRVIYSSTIAVLGDPLPKDGVDDLTPLCPKMVYGGHKAMMELALAMMHNRGELEAISVRFPGILARPKGPSGMKSAFMSDIFHALRAGERFVCPVSKDATIWAQSVASAADNLVRALDIDTALMPATHVVTLPALRLSMGDLATEIARQCGVSSDELVTYQPDTALEAAFGNYPLLSTIAADHAGFAHDGDVARLVDNCLMVIAES